MVSFLSPLLIWGTLLGAIPIVIHIDLQVGKIRIGDPRYQGKLELDLINGNCAAGAIAKLEGKELCPGHRTCRAKDVRFLTTETLVKWRQSRAGLNLNLSAKPPINNAIVLKITGDNLTYSSER